MTLLYVLVLWSWGKRTPTSFWETRLRESKPMSKIIWVQKAEGNEAQWNDSSLHVGAVHVKLRETYPISFWETRLRKSTPRSKFVWVQKANGNEAHTWLGSQGQVKRLFSTCWCSEAEGNVPQQVLEKPGRGKVNHVKICLGPEGQGK